MRFSCCIPVVLTALLPNYCESRASGTDLDATTTAWLLRLRHHSPTSRAAINLSEVEWLLVLNLLVAAIVEFASSNPLQSPRANHFADAQRDEVIFAFTIHILAGRINCWVCIM
ncbi:MAG: hypothetical protein CXZ00_12415 [Acidobacteria bacterium]|nr:MAG: hypothetical protein CXZ00_12415 [Acidobacteriota bacterium]